MISQELKRRQGSRKFLLHPFSRTRSPYYRFLQNIKKARPNRKNNATAGANNVGNCGRISFSHEIKGAVVRFEFSATSSGEWNSIFQNFSKKEETSRVTPKFSVTFSQKFSFLQRCSRNFQNFRLNGSHFGNSTVSGISGNFSAKFLYHLPQFPNFGKF